MAFAPVYIEASPVTPAPYGLLATIPPVQDSDPHIGMGVQYESEFCGVALPFSPTCVTADVGSISVSVDDSSDATVTSTGLPAGTYTVDWGDGTVSTNVTAPLNVDRAYLDDGDYVITVSPETGGATASVTVTITDGVPTGPFEADAQEAKVPTDGFTTVLGEPIPVYHLFTCRAPGSWERGQERARRSLELGASRALESAFQTVIATGAVDVTPGGTAGDIVDGLALLEEYAAANYGGTPVIHMTRGDATRLHARRAIVKAGNHLETALGSLVVAGAGYSRTGGPSAPAAGAGWMIATGQVAIRQSKVLVTEAVLDNPYTNDFRALAETVYVPTYECFNAAVEVVQSACCA